MLTIFSIPKPFEGHIGVIQKNAIASWSKLTNCQVLLFGDEQGVAECAEEFSATHIPEVRRNQFGTPLLSTVFMQAQALARYQMIAYVNCDIVLLNDFMLAAQLMINSPLDKFLVVGQRHDIDISQPLNFDSNWQSSLRLRVADQAKLHGKAGMDYFLFKKGIFENFPEFAVGRPGWDSWLLFHAHSLKIPIVDATNTVLAVHQNHPARYQFAGPETQMNIKLAGGWLQLKTMRDADYILTSEGVKRPNLKRRLIMSLTNSAPGKTALLIKRTINNYRARARLKAD